jgi:hypothetical protein
MSAIGTGGMAGGTSILTRGYGYGWIGGGLSREVIRIISTIRRALARKSIFGRELATTSTIRPTVERTAPIDIEED